MSKFELRYFGKLLLPLGNFYSCKCKILQHSGQTDPYPSSCHYVKYDIMLCKRCEFQIINQIIGGSTPPPIKEASINVWKRQFFCKCDLITSLHFKVMCFTTIKIRLNSQNWPKTFLIWSNLVTLLDVGIF